MKKIAVLVSHKGTGSNLKAVLEAGLDVCLVLADREEAPGIEIAKENNIPFEILAFKVPDNVDRDKYRDEYSLNLAKILNKHEVEIAVLAGFNRIITKPYFDMFTSITVNIHPGAIPEHEGEEFEKDGEIIPWNKGMMTEQAVANFLPLKTASSTIHIVTEKADFGPILKRVFVSVRNSDNMSTLYSRLKIEENAGLIEVLKNL